MDLLITVLGNAVVHDKFRETLFNGDPVAAVEAWGFRLTKGDNELLREIFKGDRIYINDLKGKFNELYEQVYKNILSNCGRPCKMSVDPPVCQPRPTEKAA